MSNEVIKRYRIRIRPLTPIHIGNGETIEPYSYLHRGNEVWILSTLSLLDLLPSDAQQFYLAGLEMGPFEARKRLGELASKYNLEPAASWKAPSYAGFNSYVSRSLQEGRGELAIRTLPRSLNGPYLPGSSLKGALRTIFLFDVSRSKLGADFDEDKGAWTGERDLEWRSRRRGRLLPGEWFLTNPGEGLIKAPLSVLRPGRREKRDSMRVNVRFEAFLLNNPAQKESGDADILRDPLRTLATSDTAPIPSTEFRLVEVYGSKENPTGPTGIRLLAETWSRGEIFSEIRIHAGLQTNKGSLLRRNGQPGPMPSLKDIAIAAYERYISLAEDEYYFFDDNGWRKAAKSMERVMEAIESCLEDDGALKKPYRFPIRLGFGSGGLTVRLAEFLEFEGAYNVTRIAPRSRKLAEEEPMGWAMVEVVE